MEFTAGAKEYINFVESFDNFKELVKANWNDRRIVSRHYVFEFTKQEFLTALNEVEMAKKKIESGGIQYSGETNNPEFITPLDKVKSIVKDITPYSHSGVDHPLFLTVEGQTVFHKIILFLKKNGNWDDTYLEMIAAAAATYQNYCIAQKRVNEYGPTTETGAGGLKKNPAIDIASASFRDFMTFSNKFGLNPLFEGKIKKNEDDDSEI